LQFVEFLCFHCKLCQYLNTNTSNSIHRHLTTVDLVADFQDTDRPRPTVSNQLITMIYIITYVRNQFLFVFVVARWSETNWFCPFMCIPNMQLVWHLKQSAVLSLQV